MKALQRPGRAAAVVGGLVAVGASTVLALAAGTATAAEQGRCTDNVNVRSEPSMSAPVVGVCQRGTSVPLGERRSGFVELPSLGGWASDQYVSTSAPATSSGSGSGTNAGSGTSPGAGSSPNAAPSGSSSGGGSGGGGGGSSTAGRSTSDSADSAPASPARPASPASPARPASPEPSTQVGRPGGTGANGANGGTVTDQHRGAGTGGAANQGPTNGGTSPVGGLLGM